MTVNFTEAFLLQAVSEDLRERFGLVELTDDMFADVAEAVEQREPGTECMSDRRYAEFVEKFGQKYGLGHA
eukprot:SAG31_NODE_730_length_12505_cov_3.807109_7_plen_71_part_00